MRAREDLLLAAGVVVAGMALVGALVLTFAGCRSPEPVEPRVVFTPTPCLTAADAPPEPPGAAAVAGPEDGCKDERGCVTPRLYVWVAATLRWQREVWTRCSPPTAPPPATGETP